jgi:hypothetical protein
VDQELEFTLPAYAAWPIKFSTRPATNLPKFAENIFRFAEVGKPFEPALEELIKARHCFEDRSLLVKGWRIPAGTSMQSLRTVLPALRVFPQPPSSRHISL